MLANVFTKTIRDRWLAMAIGTATLVAFLLLGMWTYRDIDLSLYTVLPEAMRELMGITSDSDAGGLAYGAMYSSYGALTLAALALSMGAASIAGEERNGTIGLLLGNPQSRTHVLLSKAASMVALIGLGALLLWGAGLAVPAMLDVDVEWVGLSDFEGIGEIEEDGATFAENARKKALGMKKWAKKKNWDFNNLIGENMQWDLEYHEKRNT